MKQLAQAIVARLAQLCGRMQIPSSVSVVMMRLVAQVHVMTTSARLVTEVLVNSSQHLTQRLVVRNVLAMVVMSVPWTNTSARNAAWVSV